MTHNQIFDQLKQIIEILKPAYDDQSSPHNQISLIIDEQHYAFYQEHHQQRKRLSYPDVMQYLATLMHTTITPQNLNPTAWNQAAEQLLHLAYVFYGYRTPKPHQLISQTLLEAVRVVNPCSSLTFHV